MDTVNTTAIITGAGSGIGFAVAETLVREGMHVVLNGRWEASLGGFPALAVVPGQFLVKDVVLLGAALWSLGEALSTSR